MLSQRSSYVSPQSSARLRTHPVLAAKGQTPKPIAAASCFGSDQVSQYSRMGAPLRVVHGIEDIRPSVKPLLSEPQSQWPLEQSNRRNQTHHSQFTYCEEGQRWSPLSPPALSFPFSKSRPPVITPPAMLRLVDETTSGVKTDTTTSAAQTNSFRQKVISRPSQKVRVKSNQTTGNVLSAIKPNMSAASLPSHPPKVQLSVQRHEVKDQQQSPQYLRLGDPLRVVCGIEDVVPCVKPLLSEHLRPHLSETVFQSQPLSEVRKRSRSAQFCSTSAAQVCCLPSTGIAQTSSVNYKPPGLPQESRSPATLTIEDETAVDDSNSSSSTAKESFNRHKMTRSSQDTILKVFQSTQGPSTTLKQEVSASPLLHPGKETEEGKPPSQPVSVSSSAAPQQSSKRPPPPTSFLLSQAPSSLRRHPLFAASSKARPSLEPRANTNETQSYKSTIPATSSSGSRQFSRMETPALASADNTQYATPRESVRPLRMQQQIVTQMPTAELREKRPQAPMLFSPAAEFLSTMPPPLSSPPFSSSPLTSSPQEPAALDPTYPLKARLRDNANMILGVESDHDQNEPLLTLWGFFKRLFSIF